MKTKRILAIILCVLIVVIAAACPFIGAVYATPDEPAVEQVEDVRTDIATVADDFTAYLKERYGDDYQYYYDKIIENWGSIEAYLLSFGEKLPDEYKSSWDKFVGWLKDYAPVWAVPFAVAFLIISVLIGKKNLEKIIRNAVDNKVAPIVGELNKQSKGIAALSAATKDILPKNDKCAEDAQKLDDSVKELTNG